MVEGIDQIPVTDRGLQYGDGLFETLLLRKGRPWLWPQHFARLVKGCQKLGLRHPDPHTLADKIHQAGQGNDAVVKVLITRGDGPRGYRPPIDPEPRCIVTAGPVSARPFTHHGGIRVHLCHTRLAVGHVLAGVKHLNRLEQVLARAEWDDHQIAEGLMGDANGNLIEGTMSNVFIEQNGQLLTPNIDQCGVAGIMRDEILKLAKELSIPVTVTKLPLSVLDDCASLFVCNSVIGIWPVATLGSRRLTIGSLTTQLISQLNHLEAS